MKRDLPARISETLTTWFILIIVTGLAVAGSGQLVRTQVQIGLIRALGQTLVSVGLWAAIAFTLLALLTVALEHLLRAAFLGLDTLLALLASGGLILLLEPAAESPQENRRRHQGPVARVAGSVLALLASGGLSLLIQDIDEGDAPMTVDAPIPT